MEYADSDRGLTVASDTPPPILMQPDLSFGERMGDVEAYLSGLDERVDRLDTRVDRLDTKFKVTLGGIVFLGVAVAAEAKLLIGLVQAMQQLAPMVQGMVTSKAPVAQAPERSPGGPTASHRGASIEKEGPVTEGYDPGPRDIPPEVAEALAKDDPTVFLNDEGTVE